MSSALYRSQRGGGGAGSKPPSNTPSTSKYRILLQQRENAIENIKELLSDIFEANEDISEANEDISGIKIEISKRTKAISTHKDPVEKNAAHDETLEKMLADVIDMETKIKRKKETIKDAEVRLNRWRMVEKEAEERINATLDENNKRRWGSKGGGRSRSRSRRRYTRKRKGIRR